MESNRHPDAEGLAGAAPFSFHSGHDSGRSGDRQARRATISMWLLAARPDGER
jgi:hypothetical protein